MADLQGEFKVMMSSRSPSALSFCRVCHTMFDYTAVSKPELTCEDCGYVQKFDPDQDLQQTTYVMERVRPPWWALEDEKLEAALQGKEEEVMEYPEIEHECGQCGAKKVQFWTRQLRSADEGQTIFYLCKKCGWRAMEHS
mmetsp:Transcript_17225/g.31792  ORF Transcript_17225/g.31792 Transcript_17225/m.31792 type:complete len:140 (-) Transcript_17225:86-505(-)